MEKSNRFRWLAATLTALIFLAAVSTYAWVYRWNPCEEQAVKEASAFLTAQLAMYDGQYQFTTTVYRSGLDAPVYKLQQIFMNTQAVEVPACMQSAKNELLDYMRTVIRAFDAFGAGEEDTTIRELIDQANTHYDNFNAELEAVDRCAPFCLP